MQGRSDQTPSEGGKPPPQAFIPVIDTEGESLAPDRIFVRRTPIGYLCAGFGNASTLLRFAFGTDEGGTSRLEAACRRLDKSIATEGLAKARRLGLEIPLGEIDDPHLRRLAIAVALLKAGFDPDQPRDDHGRWTDGGGESAAAGPASDPAAVIGTIPVAGTATAVADATLEGPAWTKLPAAFWELLPRVAARIAGPIAVAGGILVPSTIAQMPEGTLPGRPDVTYQLNETELNLSRTDEQGQRTVFFVSRRDDEGYYHDEQGNIVGRYVNGAFVLDPVGVAGILQSKAGDKVDAEEETDEAKQARRAALLAKARAIVQAVDKAQVCPDLGLDREGAGFASADAQKYQTQITQLPFGVGFELNNVMFDGCEYWAYGDMLEAKDNYLWTMEKPGEWKDFFVKKQSLQDMEGQMARQSAAADMRLVKWHFADAQVAEYFRGFAQANHLDNIVVIHTPRSW